jgi:hypothetical protein
MFLLSARHTEREGTPAMKTIARNFRKNPHTATFLQTFHSGISSTGRNYREELNVDENQAEIDLAAAEAGDLLDEVEELDVVDHRTAGQVEFMENLIRRLIELDPTTGQEARKYTDDMTTHGAWTAGRDGKASKWIDRMIAKERALKAQAPAPTAGPAQTSEVPNGRYAVEENGTLKFFHVRHGKADSRWAGFVFVDIQASDDTYPLKDRARKARVLAAIAQDVEGSLCRYGQELGVCGDCGRTLTDETSRSIGRGPICRSK